MTVHSFRVTALTTARENGSDIVELQGFAGQADPRTTQSYIRTGDRLHKSPAYSLELLNRAAAKCMALCRQFTR